MSSSFKLVISLSSYCFFFVIFKSIFCLKKY
jgi:hypothetical protein